ncbi:probable CCR4-associated factor 1 homolog 11 [Triticum aestivum]|nr:probable CCR4-associated factor 1 homolog 11 [Triticum aestivum]
MNPTAGMFPMFPPPPPPPMPFYHTSPMQPPPFYFHAVAVPVPSSAVPVRSVWAWNFREESDRLCHLAWNARYVAVNVHYPGLVHHADRNHNILTVEERYAVVKANVDALKPLQVGIALRDGHGRHLGAWEFNLRDFCPVSDPHDESSLAYLAGRGLDVDRLRVRGLSAKMLREKLLRSGLFDPRCAARSWVTYAGAYHIAYLLKIVTGGAPLPQDMAGFVGAVRRYLGVQVYDVARMAAECPGMPLGLERIADHLGFHPPLGSPRLAAAAGVHALQVFMRLKYRELGGDVERHRGLLHGLH